MLNLFKVKIKTSSSHIILIQFPKFGQRSISQALYFDSLKFINRFPFYMKIQINLKKITMKNKNQINMKNKDKTERSNLQRLLDEQNEIEGQVAKLQSQIHDLESVYLQRTWYDGNVYIGWNKNIPSNNPGINHVKINIDAKDRIFSLSSISSPAFQQLFDNVDRQLAPYGQTRFQSKKKNKKNKKRNANQMRRPRSIRKKRRR